MTYKVYTKDNYLYVEDTSGNINEGVAKDVVIRRSNTSQTSFRISGLRNRAPYTFDVSDLTDENGVAYTSSTFIDFYRKNTGENAKSSVNVEFSDGASIDAFSRLRVSDPQTLFSCQSQYTANTIQMELGNTGTGVLPAHSANDRMVKLRCTAGSGTSFTQSFSYIAYQPSKSHFIAITGLFTAGVAGAVVDIGYFDANNGIFLRQNGASGLQIVRRTKTSGSVVDNVIDKADWNINTLSWFDETKTFILLIDLQFLGMGRVRCYMDYDGIAVLFHEFLNANNMAVPYMQTATLPIQMLLTATTTAGAKDAYFKCAAVSSEGGLANDFAFSFSTPEATETAASGARTHLMSIRPKTTYNSIENRVEFVLSAINMITTGANPVYWELVIGATFAASTWADINGTYSGFEYTSVRGAFTNLTNGIVIASGYSSGSGSGAAAAPPSIAPINLDKILSQRYPITLNRAGAVRDMGTLTLLITGIGGTSATRASINFKEIR